MLTLFLKVVIEGDRGVRTTSAVCSKQYFSLLQAFGGLSGIGGDFTKVDASGDYFGRHSVF